MATASGTASGLTTTSVGGVTKQVFLNVSRTITLADGTTILQSNTIDVTGRLSAANLTSIQNFVNNCAAAISTADCTISSA